MCGLIVLVLNVFIRWDKKTSWEETIEWFNRNFPDV